MKNYITLDGGTTNTRLTLVREGEVIDRIGLGIGVQKNIGEQGTLEREVKRGIERLLCESSLSECDIEVIIASGMVTSEFGLCNLPHVAAPAGIAELHEGIERTSIPEITSIPFAFIRGVKTPSQDFEHFDVMRGEETELMGIIKDEYKDALYILPGSHSKIIKTDTSGRIIDFSTMLTGEMIKTLSENTILKGALDLSTAKTVDEYLIRGYDYATSYGLNKALFKVRVLRNFFGATNDEAYSFFIGAVLAGEMKEIIDSDAPTVVIGGRLQLRCAMAKILSERDNKRVVFLDEREVDLSTVNGAIRIFEVKTR